VQSTPLATVFRILKTRGATGAQEGLGTEFPGGGETARVATYDWIAPERRQVCWAHGKRDFLALSERGGESARMGHALLAAERQLVEYWTEVRRQKLSRADFQVRMRPGMTHVKALLQAGARGAYAKTAGPCRHLLPREASLWTFVWEDDVWSPPTIMPSVPYAGRCGGGGAVSARKAKRGVTSWNGS
jgi:transposase